MPARAGVQLAVIMLLLPTQYFVSRWFSQTGAADREYFTRRLVRDSLNFYGRLKNTSEWRNMYREWHDWLFEDAGECPATEVMRFNEPRGYFAGSPEPRTHRQEVLYRVGQVVENKRFGYRGVIVGWDYKAQAPDSWLQVNHVEKSWRNEANYAVLVDTRDRTDVQTTYVVERSIQVLSKQQVEHPKIADYFEYFDGAQYIPRPWLKELYPQD